MTQKRSLGKNRKMVGLLSFFIGVSNSCRNNCRGGNHLVQRFQFTVDSLHCFWDCHGAKTQQRKASTLPTQLCSQHPAPLPLKPRTLRSVWGGGWSSLHGVLQPELFFSLFEQNVPFIVVFLNLFKVYMCLILEEDKYTRSVLQGLE